MVATKEDLIGARGAIDKILDEKNCGPIFVRLAWHDSGPHDASVKEPWPAQGGADGSIRFAPEINHGANAGLINAVKLLEPVKEAFPSVSYADIYQMASARAIELAGGPVIDMKYGRVDTQSPDECPKEGNLPDAEAGPNGKFGGSGGTASTEDSTAEGHLRKVFFRMGFDDEGIVALSGAHTFGELLLLMMKPLYLHILLFRLNRAIKFIGKRSGLQGSIWCWCGKDQVHGW